MAKEELTGLLLGAGASYEAGMPLVDHLTDELRQLLLPDKLHTLNEGWREQGGGHPDEVVEQLADKLKELEHYEQVLGWLERQAARRRSHQNSFRWLRTWFVEQISFLFVKRHLDYANGIKRSVRYYAGLGSLADSNRPLWVFSLNHDMIVECIAADLDIPVCAGFSDEQVRLPRRDSAGLQVGELQAEVLPKSWLKKQEMAFLGRGERGINLMKIHGGLDVFTFRDGKDLLRILPEDETPTGILQTLEPTNLELRYVDDREIGGQGRVMNEIPYEDEHGVMQFLRRSLVSGESKYDSRADQVLPLELLEQFKLHLNRLESLVCVGYGFADAHVNEIIRHWLEFDGQRRLVIVDPCRETTPKAVGHLVSQIELKKLGATEYFDQLGGIGRNRDARLEKQVLTYLFHHGESGKKEFEDFMEEWMASSIDDVVSSLAELPVKDGDVNFKQLDMTKAEVVEKLTSDIAGQADMMEEFLRRMGSK